MEDGRPMPQSPSFTSSAAAFFGGVRSAWTSVFFLVMAGTYVGLGALAHDFGLSALWLTVSTLLIWAGPAQVILVSALGSGAAPIEVAIGVTLSGIRLLPMVVALLPLLKGPQTRQRDLLLPAHFTSVSMWVESLRLLPAMPRERRIAYCNGLSVGFNSTAVIAGLFGFFLAAKLPPLFAGGLLFLTPMSFLVSTARNARTLMDRLALALGLVLGAALAAGHVELDLMWSGLGGGTIAYLVQRFRRGAA
jgi:predicted branched-subunit amino acid permease